MSPNGSSSANVGYDDDIVRHHSLDITVPNRQRASAGDPAVVRYADYVRADTPGHAFALGDAWWASVDKARTLLPGGRRVVTSKSRIGQPRCAHVALQTVRQSNAAGTPGWATRVT